MLWKRPFFFRGLEVYFYELKLLILWDSASIHLAAASTIFEERNSLVIKGVAFFSSEPIATFCMIIALFVSGVGGADPLVQTLDRPGHPLIVGPAGRRR